MITSFRIKNFRGFQDLTIQPLKRVNLIGGKNNTGKTALLEALLLHNGPTNPQLSVEIHRFRGIESPMAAIEDVCRWLFHGGNPSSPIETESCNDTGECRKLTIRMVSAAECRRDYSDAERLLIDHFHPNVSASDGIRVLLNFESSDGTKNTSIGVSQMGTSFLSFQAPPTSLGPTFLVISSLNAPRPFIDAFGELERTKRLETRFFPHSLFWSRGSRPCDSSLWPGNWLFTAMLTEPDLRLGQAAQSGYIDFAQPEFAPLKAFIQSL